MLRKYDWIAWDFNGTLLDDARLCLECLNILCRRRGLPEVSWESYRDTLAFPVEDFYRSVGFDFREETYPAVAEEWLTEYLARVHDGAKLHPGVGTILADLHDAGYSQLVLSAYYTKLLEESLRRLGIRKWFDTVLGGGDILASGKEKTGKDWLTKNKVPPGGVVLIGDTLHDVEVAGGMGIDCVLVTCGHQSRSLLETSGSPVLDSVSSVPSQLEKKSGIRFGQEKA